jgi:hypothetical protein
MILLFAIGATFERKNSGKVSAEKIAAARDALFSDYR